jgi:hypothetical protein
MLCWQMNQLGYDPMSLWSQTGVEAWQPPASAAADEWKPLAELWYVPDGDTPETEWFFYPMLVVEYVVEVHGVEKVPEMVDALMAAGSMEEWVAAVTGLPLDQFEADWREWVIANRKDD